MQPMNPMEMPNVSKLNALATWRLSKGIYQFDKDLLNALISTPLHNMPVEIFYRIPEWCIYIQYKTHLDLINQDIEGFFFSLEYDVNNKSTELRFVFDTGSDLMPFVLHLKNTLHESIKDAFDLSNKYLAKAPSLQGINPIPDEAAEIVAPYVTPLISLVLYLCSENHETVLDNKLISENNRFVQPTKTKRGLRFFAVEKPSFYEIGYRVGKTLRQYDYDKPSSESHKTRPHIRRAHWHTYLTGKRTEVQIPSIKWLPPIFVNTGEEALIPTIHTVR
jgi:hypothetical protein